MALICAAGEAKAQAGLGVWGLGFRVWAFRV